MDQSQGAAEDVIAQFRDADWFQRRPVTTEWREHRALIALHDELKDPWSTVEVGLGAEDWKRIIDSLRERGLLKESGRVLTDHGRRVAEDLLFEHHGKLPDLSPGGRFQPFRRTWRRWEQVLGLSKTIASGGGVSTSV